MRSLDLIKHFTLAGLLAFSLSAAAHNQLGNCSYVLNGTAVHSSEGGIYVSRPGEIPEYYRRTERNIELLMRDYPASMLNTTELVGKSVLDAGTGDGAFVYELNTLGVHVVGLDLLLNDRQLQRPDLFERGDMLAMPYANDSFDVVYSSWSLITFETDEAEQKISQIAIRGLREIYRVLKPGGVARIAPVYREKIERHVRLVPGFKISPRTTAGAIELIKE